MEGDTARFAMRISAGGYVRAIAHAMGQALGCGAHLASLRRTAAGPFTLEQALTLDEVEALAAEGKLEERMPHPRTLLPEMPAVTADEQTAGADSERDAGESAGVFGRGAGEDFRGAAGAGGGGEASGGDAVSAVCGAGVKSASVQRSRVQRSNTANSEENAPGGSKSPPCAPKPGAPRSGNTGFVVKCNSRLLPDPGVVLIAIDGAGDTVLAAGERGAIAAR